MVHANCHERNEEEIVSKQNVRIITLKEWFSMPTDF